MIPAVAARAPAPPSRFPTSTSGRSATGSRSRVWQVGKARELLLEHRAPDTPVVLGRDIGGPEESVRIIRLADLDPAEVDMRTILLVGSSQTRTTRRGDGTEIVWTPRRYPEA